MTTQTKAEAGQVSLSAADIYDRDFVPALFGQFAPMLADAARIGAGETVLDIGCGTGIAALAAARRGAEVTGVDLNAGMLAVARRKAPDLTWIEAPAEDLPFADGGFDVVLCQFALMFFADRPRALREMARVTRPGGRVALMTWEAAERSPGYDRLIPLLDAVAGPEAARALSAPFILGDPAVIDAELASAGLTPTDHRVLSGTARHASLDDWIDTEIGGWTLADIVTDNQRRTLKSRARTIFSDLAVFDGSLAFPAPVHLVIARP
ncbi:MAG: methyltransferase type 11 [Alphaproteobacteria bacterium HGW-Alphaproteobacteria-6]|nr:MAG: methyltransferase type 11 [Alphaproteobacteria bacterium HGW-Alphaproteobacteria-6]